MALLKRNSFILCLLLMGCATSSFKISKESEQKTELSVSPDRITLECEYLFDGGEDGLIYGFTIHVLDEKNTVIDVVQTNNLAKSACFKHIREINKILKNGKNIYIGGMGELKVPRVVEKDSYSFPNIGTFRGNGRMLQFHAIANEKGSCYSAYYGKEKPCPRNEFPIK